MQKQYSSLLKPYFKCNVFYERPALTAEQFQRIQYLSNVLNRIKISLTVLEKNGNMHEQIHHT